MAGFDGASGALSPGGFTDVSADYDNGTTYQQDEDGPVYFILLAEPGSDTTACSARIYVDGALVSRNVVDLSSGQLSRFARISAWCVVPSGSTFEHFVNSSDGSVDMTVYKQLW